MKPTKQTVYLPVKVEDETLLANKIYNFLSETEENKILFSDKFTENQINNKLPQTLGFDLIKEHEGYFFTPEQLNEYTQSVIKQSLETASQNADTCIEKGMMDEYRVVDKKSITNTAEETFNKFKV